MIAKHASVYLIKSKYVFCTCAQTVEGVLISLSPYIYLDIKASSIDIGDACQEVLANFKNDIPHPANNEWSSILSSHLANLGLKNMAELHNKASCCSILMQEEKIFIGPTKNEGPKKGYVYLPEFNLSIDSTASVEQISFIIKEGFKRCI